MFMKKLYQVTQIYPGVYQIMESGLDAMYLICQKERTILIDAGTGIGDLESCIRMYSDAPLSVYITHGHRDHFGGAGQFSEVHLAPEDFQRVSGIDAVNRREYVEKMIASKAVSAELINQVDIREWPCQPKLVPLKEGQVISWGEWNLEVLAVPGHTEGSMAFFDRKKNVIFSGDCANPIMVFRKSGSETYQDFVARWLERVKEMDSQINDETLICAGHGVIQRTVWKQLIEAAEGYLDGTLSVERRKIHFFDDNFIMWKDVQIMLG